MKYLLLLLVSFSAISAVQPGSAIKAIEFNNSTFTIGDIKNSILTLSEFKTLHGNCWIQLNDETSVDINISGTDLSSLKGVSTVKSSAGRVLRAKGGLSAGLGATQEDEFSNHNHGGGNHRHNFVFARGTPAVDYRYLGFSSANQLEVRAAGDRTVTDSISYSNDIITPQGGAETRSKNLTVNMFIKVNHSCN